VLGLIVLAVTTLFAAASYFVIELPFLNRRVVYMKPLREVVVDAGRGARVL
jgi:peptidoglycan/LPS O-acetylase OafA/YrhL